MKKRWLVTGAGMKKEHVEAEGYEIGPFGDLSFYRYDEYKPYHVKKDRVYINSFHPSMWLRIHEDPAPEAKKSG